jgi:hypothetical protein
VVSKRLVKKQQMRSFTRTAFGPVNPRILEALQESFDTQQLVEFVDQLDELRARICDPEGLRADLLKLHAMAHSVIDGASMAMEAGIRVSGNWPMISNMNWPRSRKAHGMRPQRFGL